MLFASEWKNAARLNRVLAHALGGSSFAALLLVIALRRWWLV